MSAEALERCPVWSHWDPEVDRERVLSWGVTAEAVDRRTELFEVCGPVPLYPVLDVASLGDRKDLVVAASFELAGGTRLDGYLLEPHAFGIFHDGEEYSFNRNLPAFSEREAMRLAAALGEGADSIFPLGYRIDPRVPVDDDEGGIPRFW